MKKVLWSLLIILLIGSAVLIQAILAGNGQKQDEKTTAIEIAKEKTKLTEPEDYYLYNGNESWSVVTGKDKNGKKIGVWIPNGKNKEIEVIHLSEGLNEKEAIQIVKDKKKVKSIVSANLGMEKNQPLWEIVFKNSDDLYGYYYLNFKTGDLIRNYDNL